MFYSISNPSSSFILPSKISGTSQYQGFMGTRVTTRNIPMNPNLVAGPGSAAAMRARQQIADRNNRMRANRLYSRDPWAQQRTMQGRPESPGANQRTKALSYYFEGQYGSGSQPGLKTTFALDPGQMLSGTSMSEAIQKFHSMDWKQQDPTLTNLQPNYYLGFGNIIKGPDKHLAAEYTRLRQFGTLGDIGRETALGQYSAWMKATEQERKQRRIMEAAARIPKAHWQPETQGEYQLGNMQGQRLRAWERRQAERQAELEKKKLKVAGPSERVQHEARIAERASTR